MITVIFDGLAYGMLLFLMSVGLAITLNLMNIVNLAHGAFAMIGGYTAAITMNHYNWSFPAAIGGAFALAGLIGIMLEFTIYRRLYRCDPLDQVLLSIGLVFVSVAAVTYSFGPTMQPLTLPPFLEGQVNVCGSELGRYRIFLVGSGILLYGILQIVFHRTRFGSMVRAAVDNQRIASSLGINVSHFFLLTFGLGSGLAGLGGALSLGILPQEPTFPLKYLTYFLIVVCIGGVGTVSGPFFSALGVGILDTASKYYLHDAGNIPIYLFILSVLLLQPQGLIQRRGRI